ncbi:MAG TPA: HlyD family efflux transporter periplasmic adaptor subunit [Clostridia bacterium]|nr:HlyD family efflux transporter periplasmic adaptor subunit [Clostridia bacterium]
MNSNMGVSSKPAGKLPVKKLIIIAIALLLIAAITFAGINYFKSKGAKNAAVQQATASAQVGDLTVSVSGSGPISSANKYDLTSNVNGTLTKIYFKDGDKVKAGDLIFEIDDKDTQLQIKQLHNSIAQAQLTRDSNIKDLESSTVTAPIDGEILDVQIKEGDNISNNSTLLTITDKSKLKLLVPFNNTYRNKLSVGQKVTVNAYDSDKDELFVVEGSISSISTPSYSTSNGAEVYNVDVIMDNSSSLKEGMIGNVEINIDGFIAKSKGSNTLSYLKSMTVKAASGGTLSKLNVQNGQNVKKGDILAELDNDDLELTIQTDNLKLEDLGLELQTVEERLLDFKIYAPFDGTFTLNDIEQGNSIKQGDILGSVANYDTMEFIIDVDELDIAKIQTGQNANVTIDALSETTDKPLKGTVSKIAVEGTSSNGVSTYPVTIQIEKNPALKGSMSANAEIVVSQKTNILYVPVDAVTKRNGKSFVRVVSTAAAADKNANSPDNEGKSETTKKVNNQKNGEQQQIEMREVKTGISNAEYIEITSGLKEGEKVVVTSASGSGNNMQNRMMIMGGPPSGGGNVRRSN